MLHIIWCIHDVRRQHRYEIQGLAKADCIFILRSIVGSVLMLGCYSDSPSTGHQQDISGSLENLGHTGL